VRSLKVILRWTSPSNISFCGSEEFDLEELGYTDKEWGELTEADQWRALDEVITETLVNLIDIDAEVVE